MKRWLIPCLVLLLLLVPSVPRAASRRPVAASHAMVACTAEVASRIGADVMRKGGNAVDAAVAVALALAVAWPEAGNIGGGGFMLVRMADGRTEAIDYRERAPMAATENMYREANGRVNTDASTNGYRAVAVPGTVAGLQMALQRYGTMRWADLVGPAEQLAADGFAVNAELARRMRTNAERLRLYPDSKRILLRDGRLYNEGERLVQPQLAATLQRLRKQGPREFYEGETARRIVADMKAHGGLITLEDLRSYRPVVRKPLVGSYRGFQVISMPPPSSGGVVLLEMLNMTEAYDLKQLGFHSADQIHVGVEIMRRAFADRATELGDPDFVTNAVGRLISKEYAAGLVKTIDINKAKPSSVVRPPDVPSMPEHNSTTHFDIVDAAGNCVSNTYTLNDSFGSAVTATGTGVLLNDEMDDFASAPGVPNMYGLLQGKANAIAPGKRPLSSMTPTILLKDGRPFLLIGSRGGPTIINSVYQAILNVIDYGMDVQEAIDAPRFHHQWMPDLIYTEPFCLNKDTAGLLEARGHKFSDKPYSSTSKNLGDTEAVMIDPQNGTRYGAADPRLCGVPAGY